MRKNISNNTTINMMFLCESKINIQKNSIVTLPKSNIEVKFDGKNLKIYKDETTLKTKIVDFKNLCAEMIGDLNTLDFWTKEFLEDITKEEYISCLTLSNAISSNGKTGYILEAIVSFPKNSEFYIKWNNERKRKGELFMRKLSNC